MFSCIKEALAYAYTCVWRSEVKLGCHFQKLSALVSETGSLTGTWGLLLRLDCQAGKP